MKLCTLETAEGKSKLKCDSVAIAYLWINKTTLDERLQFSFQSKFVNNFFVDWFWWTKCQKWKHKCDSSDSNWVHTERWFDSFSLLLLCYCQTYQYLERKEKIQRKRIGRQIPTILTTLVKCPGKGNFFYRVTTGSTKDQSLPGTSYSDTIITEDGQLFHFLYWDTI